MQGFITWFLNNKQDVIHTVQDWEILQTYLPLKHACYFETKGIKGARLKEKEIEQAVIKRGIYRFKEQYRFLEISESGLQ